MKDKSPYFQALVDAGFTEHQAEIYVYLVENGPKQASIIARRTGISRTLTYRVLKELQDWNLVTRKDPPGEISIFIPAHPLKLNKIIEQKQKELELAKTSVAGVIDSLTAEYNKSIGKPGVLFYEGIDGLERLYEDVNKTRKDIKLIRSVYDNKYEEMKELLAKQVKRQVALGIHTKLLAPLMEETKKRFIRYDEINLVSRRIIPKKHLMLPAQILIYGSKVGITSFEKQVFTTIIDNKNINKTYNIMFDYMWMMSREEDKRIKKELLEG